MTSSTEFAKILPGNNSLPKIQITTPAASAEIYLHGAHLTSWRPAGSSEVIFLSQHSLFEAGRAIRGGIPICFPWFREKADDPKAPQHGFARTSEWTLASIAEQSDLVVVTLSLSSSEATRLLWPHDFQAVYRISIGAELKPELKPELKLELAVINTGSEAFVFEEALHTYHRVSDARNIRVHGLDGVRYLDNRDSNREKTQLGDIVLTSPIDNVYLNTAHSIEIADPGNESIKRRIQIEKQNSLTTVVWNPWADGAATMKDLGSDEWQQMACVEASNIRASAIPLPPGKTHTMTATIRVAADAS